MSTRVRVVALGNATASDDGAALLAAAEVDPALVVPAGRPGPGLLDLLADPTATVLVDVTRSGATPGRIVGFDLADLPDAALAEPQVSSHGFGPAETLRLGRALGRALPRGTFVGIEGARFDPGTELSPEVAAALPDLVDAIAAAVAELE